MTVSVTLAVLLAASRATTVTTVTPFASSSSSMAHVLVPVATPLPPRSVTAACVTATLSLAVHLINIVLLDVT